MHRKLVRLCTYRDEFQVNLVEHRLTQEGISTYRTGEHGTLYVFENISQAIQLFVEADDLLRAQSILKEEFDFPFDEKPPKNFFEAVKQGLRDMLG
ncbi:MAG: DUF2007 domain-containing protein [Saprospiraceae bacterium]|nr:DUF2007 domain-containing protein [Saprospiraceae bacterium]